MDDRTMAQHRLNHGAEFPYDAPDAWWEMAEPKPLPATDWAHAAARGILADLTDRRGIKWALQEIDEDVRAELVASLSEIIRAAAAIQQSKESSDAAE